LPTKERSSARISAYRSLGRPVLAARRLTNNATTAIMKMNGTNDIATAGMELGIHILQIHTAHPHFVRATPTTIQQQCAAAPPIRTTTSGDNEAGEQTVTHLLEDVDGCVSGTDMIHTSCASSSPSSHGGRWRIGGSAGKSGGAGGLGLCGGNGGLRMRPRLFRAPVRQGTEQQWMGHMYISDGASSGESWDMV